MPRGTLPSSSSPSPRRRYLCTALWIVLVLVLVSACCLGGSIYWHIRNLRVHAAQLRSVKPSTLDSVSPILRSVKQDVRALRQDLALPLALAPHLGWVPRIGPTIQATQQLFSVGELLLGAVVKAWDATEDYALAVLASNEPSNSVGDTTPSLVESSQRLLSRTTDLEAAAAGVHRAADLLTAIDASRLVPRLSRPLSRVQPLMPLLTASFDGLALAPQLLARPEEQAILLLAQNNDELRPTGGFISSIGAVQIKQGLPKLISLADSYRVENWDKPHLDPPEPLRKYMGIDLWVTRDGNWWPDYPTSAKAVADLFTLNQDVPVAGVIAVNMQAAERLLEALTPFELPDGIIVQSGEVEAMFRQSWSLELDTLVTEGVIITATQPFVGVDIELVLAEKSGQAWFDSIELEDLEHPGVNLVRNPSFEQDRDLDALPDDWVTSGLAEGDGLVDGVAHSGQRSLHLVGDLEREKRLTQRIVMSGSKGARLRLTGLSRADNLSSGPGTCALSITLLPEGSATAPQHVDAGFPTLTHDWASAGSAKILGNWWAHRKDFMNLSVQAAVRRMSSSPSQVRWLDVLNTVVDLLDERQVQFYMADPALQGVFQSYGWTGALAETPGDYLLVVDSNVGYNKVTASMEQAIEYVAKIEPSGAVQAELAITYRNLSTQPVDKCDKDKQYLPIYESLAQGCYWDYVRVYVPLGTRLQSGQGGDEPFQQLDESGRTVFATSMELKPGEERVLRLEYALPEDTVLTHRYELTIQKQAGTEAIPLQVSVRGNELAPDPDGALEPAASTADQIVYRTDLRTDRHLAISVQP